MQVRAPSLERANELLSYDPDNGAFTQRKGRGGRAKGSQAGYARKDGYVIIALDGTLYLAHRLAWLVVQGEWPECDIDHIDGNPSNNRISNLRLATKSQNMGNMRLPKKNTSGVKGVHWSKLQKKWVAEIGGVSAYRHLGCYSDINDAAEAYKRAAVHLFGSFALPAKSTDSHRLGELAV